MTTIDDTEEIVIRKKGDRVIASISQLGLHAKGNDTGDALNQLQKKKEQLLSELSESELAELLPPSGLHHPSAVGKPSDLMSFTLKSLIAGAIIATAIAVPGLLVAAKVRTAADRLQLGEHQFWKKVEAQVHRYADSKNELSEEERRQLLSDIKTIAQRWRPFVSEAMLLFAPADEQIQKSKSDVK